MNSWELVYKWRITCVIRFRQSLFGDISVLWAKHAVWHLHLHELELTCQRAKINSVPTDVSTPKNLKQVPSEPFLMTFPCYEQIMWFDSMNVNNHVNKRKTTDVTTPPDTDSKSTYLRIFSFNDQNIPYGAVERGNYFVFQIYVKYSLIICFYRFFCKLAAIVRIET